MTQELHVIDTNKSTSNHSTDHVSVNIIDTLIEPLIDIDELKPTIANDETIPRREQNLSSISTVQLDEQKSSPKTSHRYVGIFMALLSSAFFTTGSFIIKELPVEMFDALLCRFILQTFIPAAFIFHRKHRLIYGSIYLISLQSLRAILTTTSFFTFFLSYQYIPLPDLTICRYTQIVWTPILAMIIFRECISVPTVVAIILTLTGAVLVAQPTFLFHSYKLAFLNDIRIVATNESIARNDTSDEYHRFLGIGLALTCAICVALSYVINKRLLVLKIPQTVILFQSSSITLVLLIVKHLNNRFIFDKYATRPMFTWAFLVAAFASVFLVFSAMLTQGALKREHPSIVTIVLSSDILYAIILQNVFTHKKSNWFVLIGAILVTTSIFLIGFHKFRQDRKKALEENSNS